VVLRKPVGNMRSTPGFNSLISSIRDCQQKHRLSFSLYLKKSFTPLIRFLTEFGFIAGYSVYSNRLFVFVRYHANGTPLLQYVEKPAFNARRIAISLGVINPLNRPFKLVIISTSRGLLLQPTACFLKIGGRVLFRCL
jgi:ribosomal protein S8